MVSTAILLLTACFITIVVVYVWYAGIITKKNKVKEALAGIDVQLTKRSDLIPNVLKIAKAFMVHERELLTQITELRTRAGASYSPDNPNAVQQHLQAADQLAGKVEQFMVAVENYPDLKSDGAMQQAQQTYNEVEEHIAAARRFYNAAVGDLNNSIEIFPGNLIAALAKASPMPFYEAAPTRVAPVDASHFI